MNSEEHIQINTDGLEQDQIHALLSTIRGLNFIALECETNKLDIIARLIRTAMLDVYMWSQQRLMFNGEKTEDQDETKDFLIDTSMVIAFEFLVKFSSIKNSQLKKDILKQIEMMEEIRAVNYKLN